MTFEEVGVIPDLLKINIEGHETALIPSIPLHVWDTCSTFVELHGTETAECIFNYFKDKNVNIFSQKLCLEKASSPSDLPKNHLEGTIFISSKPKVNGELD